MSSSSFQPLDDPIVAAFGDHRLLVEAIPGCLLLTTYFIVGTFGNLNIVAATVLNRKLRGTCNYLIAMASIFDSIHMFAHVNMTFVVFTRINIIILSQCFYLQALPIGGLICGEVVVFLIAIDRLLCLVFPTWHRSLRKWRYLPVHFFACASVSGLYVYLGFLNQQRTPDK